MDQPAFSWSSKKNSRKLQLSKEVRFSISEGMLPVNLLYPVNVVAAHNQERLVDKSITVQPHHHWGSNQTNTYRNEGLTKLWGIPSPRGCFQTRHSPLSMSSWHTITKGKLINQSQWYHTTIGVPTKPTLTETKVWQTCEVSDLRGDASRQGIVICRCRRGTQSRKVSGKTHRNGTIQIRT